MGLFDARVPRYTSYPTAPQFSDRVGAEKTAAWLAQVPAGASISLYLHVPFCRRLCWFCACRTQGTSTLSPVSAYVETLLQELALIRARMAEGVTLSRLHWGGGTPTLLPAEDIRRLSSAVTDVLPFAKDYEFSVEIDPNELDDERLGALAEAGLTRASIGVQDFDPEIQKAIGREQSYEVTAKAVEMIRSHGVTSLNMDLLYGLPFQTLERIEAGVDKVLSLRPDRVALYGYAHVPWVARRQGMIPAEALPRPEERLALAEAAEAKFRAAGYVALGIDHFALPEDGLAKAQAAGRLRRNFQGYTDDAAGILIGLGASSISRYPQGYAQNSPATGTYQKLIREGKLATSRGHEFTSDDLIRGRIIESLMCDFAADLPALAAELGHPVERLNSLCEGLAEKFGSAVEVTGARIVVPDQAHSLVRLIARYFDAYAAEGGGFSQAV